ncbi:MAG: TonB-dependent receptor plug domain-containing protein [Sphingosinicella sp.]|nr:TonB-dependent receptor plug domain-containing protein [Sphingosinicella sp.]
MSFKKSLILGLLASAMPAALQAQVVAPAGTELPAPDDAPEVVPANEDPDEEFYDEEADGEEIVVTGQRERGAVIGDIEPEIQLDRRDIRAYGAGSITELLDALAPQTQSGQGRGGGRPITLVNGRRISGFSEIRDLPPEAIERVDILPEEAALAYGYRADQRVVNFVLRRRFRATTAEVEAGFPTAGGREMLEGDVNILRLNRNGRWSLDAEYQRSSALLESERDLIGNELGEYRSLLPQSDQLSLAGTFNRTILNDISSTVNARYDESGSETRLGLAQAGGGRVLIREGKIRIGHLGVALNGDILPWRWSFTGNYDRGSSLSLTDRQREAVSLVERDRALIRTETANAELVVNGSLFDLPAGHVSTSFRVGAERLVLAGESIRSGVEQDREVARGRGTVQANVDVPIASRRRGVLSAIGDLSLNANAEMERLSDFGALTTLGGGLRWSPIAQVDLIASATDEDGAPSVQQLGDPTVFTPNVRVFDFLRGETVDIIRIDGGNGDLLADNRRVMKLGLTVKPLSETNLSLTANYISSRIRNPIASFPTATPEIEAAFPDRFQRDTDGRLLRIDNRPVNFARADRKEFRWGVNFSKPIASAPPVRDGRWRQRAEAVGPGAAGATPAEGTRPARQAGSVEQAAPGSTPPATDAPAAQDDRPRGRREGGGAGGRFGGGRFGGGPGGGRGGRLQLAFYHTWHLQNEILIRQGVPELDLLNGSATGNRGGQPRHEVEFQAGLFKNGLGARANANWKSGTNVRGGPLGGESDLRFSDLATINLRLFADLGQQRSLVEKYPVFRRTRISLSVDNIFDGRLKVRDAAGLTPISYQPDLIDPLGRSIRLSIRKQFF